jgi:type II secretory pathway pseudopilin PulG
MKIKGPTWAKRRNSAFTLAEVVIASGLIAISCVSLLIALSMGFSMVQANRENLRATQVMVQKMETLRLYNWSELQATNFLKPTFSEYFNPVSTNGVLYVGQISLSVPTDLPPNYADQIYAVTVSVCWTNYVRGQPIVHNRQMQTYAALYGMQNYVY